jgi:hypothetical protein
VRPNQITHRFVPFIVINTALSSAGAESRPVLWHRDFVLTRSLGFLVSMTAQRGRMDVKRRDEAMQTAAYWTRCVAKVNPLVL